jgi:hypothetical protein
MKNYTNIRGTLTDISQVKIHAAKRQIAKQVVNAEYPLVCLNCWGEEH